MSDTFTYAITLTEGKYEVTVTAVDSWDAESNTLITTVTIG